MSNATKQEPVYKAWFNWLTSGLVWLIGWLGTALTVSAQCPAPVVRQHMVDSVSALPDGQQVVGLLQIQQQARRCVQTTDSIYAKVLHRLGVMAYTQADYTKALAYTRQAIAVNSRPGTDKSASFRIKSLYNLGRIYTASGEYIKARHTFNQVVEQGVRFSDRLDLVADAYGALANLYYSEADYQKSIREADLGAALSSRINRYDKLVFNLQAKAQSLKELTMYADEEKTLNEIVQVVGQTSVEPIALANAYSSLADLRIRQKRYPDAQRFLGQALAQHQSTHNKYGEAQILTAIGYLYFNYLTDYQKALTYYRRALPIMPQAHGKARIIDNIGVVYWKQGRFGQALRAYESALQTLTGNRLRSKNNPDAAIIRESPYKEYLLTLMQDKANTWLDSARIAGNRRCLRHALDTYKVADQMIDFMRWEHTGQQSKLYWREKTRSMYERAIETCYLLNDAEQAFRFFEKSRAVMLADKLNELGARQQLPAAQADKEDALRKAVSEQQAEVAGIAPDSSAYKAKQTALFAKQDELDAFLKQLEATKPAYYRYKYDTTTTTLVDLQDYLRPRKASFVTYFIGDSTLYLLSVTADRTTLKRQPIGRYTQTTEAFMGLLADPDAMNRRVNLDRFMTLGADLYRQLLAPLSLPDGPVVVSPDGSSIPFGALSRSGLARKPDYLVNQYAFSYVYSARLLLKATADQARTASFVKNDFLGIAPVSFAPGLGQVSLPGSAEALSDIARSFRSPKLLTGQDATRRAFREQCANTRVIHLFTHANADDSTGSEPVLYFADSTLRLSDLGDGGLPGVQLAVLAACKTGIGADQRGEGVFSWGRGFAALGIPSVLTTLWSVENNATYEITTLFYKNLTKGLPKDIALQRAQQTWLETAGTGNQLANYWAGLIIVGDTQPLDQPNQWPWVAGGLLVLATVGVGVWLRRRRPAQPVFPFPRPAPGV